ncbi:hypothetical protein KC19_12G167500 [Ceratodon purpureus]|uniref:VQ domain-containing protein n=1 Tax=Ceratodon purpureus TaxID=3225 RepID=A0A8T0GDX8_CERPU|nr:hypothetical protein KC19_12G167400 [Ceratodon purpureus]KAG0555412.1 hypothetical protein KC19_12G167500 [Ceratodon purpureus]
MAGFNNNQQQGFGGSPKSLHQSSSSNSKPATSGLAASKVIYKRRRASRRVPTTILETSCQEFRDAVQKLTGFHRPTPSAKQTKSRPSIHMPTYDDDAHHHHQQHLDYEDDAQVTPQGQSSSPQSVLSEPTSELPDNEFFHHFLRSNMESSTSPRGKHSDASVPSLRGARFPSFANMPPHLRAAYMNRPPVGAPAGLFGPPGGRGPMPSFWDEGGMSEFMSSMAKLQDPSLAPNPYLIALENQLFLKFARRMQFAGGSNPLEHPWYQMPDHMPPMRA